MTINKSRILYILIFILWCSIVIFAGIHHIALPDEVQSWLIARDAGFIEILFKLCAYEGTPMLFQALLKVLIILKYPFKLMFLIPAFLSAIGVYLLLFKSKLNFTIKCLFPFTYFIMWQYSVICRSHSLFFPILAVIALLYTKRFDKPVIYVFSLFCLCLVSAYGYLVSVILFLYFVFELIKNKYPIRPKLILLLSYILFVFIVGFLCKTPDDCTYFAPVHFINIGRFIDNIGLIWFDYSDNIYYILEMIAIIVLYIMTSIMFCTKKRHYILFFSLNFIIILAMSMLVMNYWHQGYAVIVFIFSIWILNQENRKNINKYFKYTFYTLLSVIFLFQIVQGYQNIKLEYENDTNVALDIAEYIKNRNIENRKINAIGYNTILIQPYFKNNIFSNFNESFWLWQYNADKNKKLINDKDVYIVDLYWIFIHAKYSDIMNAQGIVEKYLSNMLNINIDDYNIKYFEQKIPYKGKIKEIYPYMVLTNKGKENN